MTYSTDDDLINVQKDILELGVTDWTVQHVEAALIIDRSIRVGWFNGMAEAKGYTLPFDSSLLLLPEELLRLSVYKTLELAYLFVMQDFIDENPLNSKWKLFKNAYEEELKIVLAVGLSYDWNNDGGIDATESTAPSSPRFITR